MTDILVFGKGYIGSTTASFFNCPVMEDHIVTMEDIQDKIDEYKPKIIIDSIGHLSKTTDDCEKDKTATLRDFVHIPLLLAEAALRNDIKLVHISNGAIYKYSDKNTVPIPEDALPDFHETLYARAKIYIEAALNSLSEAANILTVRVLHPLSYVPHPRNILTRLLKYRKVTSSPVSITYMPDFLMALKFLLKVDAEGVYNVVNYGGLKYPELLEEYRKFDIHYNYAIMDPVELMLIRTHPVLATDKLEETGFPVRDIHDVLRECCDQYWENVKK